MGFNLTGKVVGITGSAGGIGKSLAEGFAKEGCKLILCDVNEELLTKTKAELEANGTEVFAAKTDVSEEAQITKLIDDAAAHYGKIDIWISNAGIIYPKDIIDLTGDEWDRVFRINVKSQFLAGKAVFPHMKKSGGGVILNAASWTSIIPSANVSAYSASKAASLSLTRTMAGEFAPYNIRVCAYTPGFIMTEMTAKGGQYANTDAMVAPVALHRGGKPEDLVGPVLFLASEYASYMTGVTVEVSGGKLCVQNASYSWNKLAESK